MISVCMATHNGEKYISEQIDSILVQLSKEDEIVISDDGSTDNTLSIIEAYQDHRLKVHRFQQPEKSSHPHLYVTKNFENAIRQAKGDFIFLSDQDDCWMKDKVLKCMEYLKDNILVVHDAETHCGNTVMGGVFMNISSSNLTTCRSIRPIMVA